MKYIVEAEVLRTEIQKFYNNAPKGLDTETLGLDPHLAKLRTVQLAQPDTDTLVIDVAKIGEKAVTEYIKPVLSNKDAVKILHNAKFDCKFIKKHLGLDVDTVFDSFLGSIIIEAGVPTPRGYHGLGQVGERYTGTPVDKTEQKGDWSGELTESKLQYAAKDADILLPIREAMIPKLAKDGLIRVAKLEFDAVQPLAWLELSGFYLNMQQWIPLAAINRKKAQEAADKIYAILEPYVDQPGLFGPININLNSHEQVRELFERAGVTLPESTKAFELIPLADKYELVALLLEFRKHDKAATSFGESFIEFINPVTGRIHADFRQIGAETGRMSCNNPNLQQIPADKEHRSCFQAEEGNSLLSADYSQIELRILADLSGDPNAIQAFREDKVDFHTAMASKAFKVKVENVTPEERTFAKRLNFGIPYGVGAKKFSQQVNLPIHEGEMIMKEFFKAVPKEKKWLEYQKWRVLKEKNARSVAGRLVRYQFEDDDWTKKSQAQRFACNFPIQASSADMLKLALRYVYDRTKPYHDHVKLVNVVHDEINLEVPDRLIDTLSPIVQTAMLDAANHFMTECPVKVDPKVSKIWQK